MTLAPTPRPLGRVPMPVIQRFPDKPRAAVQPASVDLSGWLAPGESIHAATAAVLPATLGAVAVTVPAIDGATLKTVLSDGVEGLDFAVIFTVATSAGRTGVHVWRVYVPPLVELPDAPDGLPNASAASGETWGLECNWQQNSGYAPIL